MTLGEALELVQQRKETVRRRNIFLICQFEPLHLATFLQAHFARRFPDEAVDIQKGLYGDLEATLTGARKSEADAATVVIEWSDLDPRLGPRSSGGWALSRQADILETCRQRLACILDGVKEIAARMPVALVPPTLPIPLLGHTGSWQLSITEAALQTQIARFLEEAAGISGLAVLHLSSLARISPESLRWDVRMELGAGFPYTLQHASALASQAVKLLFPPGPMKGLITDLDETVWSGIVGEVGVNSVSWSLAEHTQMHGLYQQMLGHLSEMGVLLAIASKNDPTVVEEALRRDDLLVPAKSFFPVCVNWGNKSESTAEILRIWNIGADSVVFVDDSAMELEEVRTRFPAMTCLQFPATQPAKAVAFLEQLRDLFGKSSVHQEDALRQTSIRANATVRLAAGVNNSEFVRGLQGRLTFDQRKDRSNKRLLELINKTNQFNLNGHRLTEGEWLRLLADPESVVVSISYEDKFGPLGVIAVVAGRVAGRRLEVSTWVMSCRAFSRKIEIHTLDFLYHRGEAGDVVLAFQPTPRNGPLQEFIFSTGAAEGAPGEWILSREAFEQAHYELPHEVAVTSNEGAPLALDAS